MRLIAPIVPFLYPVEPLPCLAPILGLRAWAALRLIRWAYPTFKALRLGVSEPFPGGSVEPWLFLPGGVVGFTPWL